MIRGEGCILDIQRAALDDGPGVRTVVFFKGCPLCCPWCHNPESQSMRPELLVRADKCRHCGKCGAVCPKRAILNAQVDRNQCAACGECAKACAYGALEIAGRYYTVVEAVNEAMLDRVFFRATGGGITLSGGEPLAQPEFALKLLMTLKDEGVHTSVETCGVCADGVIETLIPYVDLWLYDVKLTDEEDHRSLLGAPLSTVLKGLKVLHKAGARVVLRCPIIPSINDNARHFATIRNLASEIGAPVEIMPYHRLGNGKYPQLGRETPFDAAIPDDGEIAAWERAVKPVLDS